MDNTLLGMLSLVTVCLWWVFEFSHNTLNARDMPLVFPNSWYTGVSCCIDSSYESSMYVGECVLGICRSNYDYLTIQYQIRNGFVFLQCQGQLIFCFDVEGFSFSVWMLRATHFLPILILEGAYLPSQEQSTVSHLINGSLINRILIFGKMRSLTRKWLLWKKKRLFHFLQD